MPVLDPSPMIRAHLQQLEREEDPRGFPALRRAAASFRPAIDAALAAPDDAFPDALEEIRQQTGEILESYCTPLKGAVLFARREPATVREMFRNLLDAAHSSPEFRQTAVNLFTSRSQRLVEQYAPERFRFTETAWSASTYLTLYAPAENWILHSTPAAEMGCAFGFEMDALRRPYIPLSVYYRVCDTLTRRASASLPLQEYLQSLSGQTTPSEADLHLYLSDLIRCSPSFVSTVAPVRDTSAVRALWTRALENIRPFQQEAERAEKALNDCLNAREYLLRDFGPGKPVRHRAYGNGTVLALDDTGVATIRFAENERRLDLTVSLRSGIIRSGDPAVQAALPDGLATLRNEAILRKAAATAARTLISGLEYLN